MKTYEIPISRMYEAFRKVKVNNGSAGVDEISIKQFEEKLEDNLYKIWNRMSSGSYFPPAVRRVEIPKGEGKVRGLGIPTVGDRVAQTVVRDWIESRMEKEFSNHSYGYRPNKSPEEAVSQAKRMCWKYDYVIDIDIKGFFDNIDHKVLMRAVEKHITEKWIRLYIERWLKAPVELEDGKRESRTQGTPQGGVISPLLANLYLHYAMDKWLEKKYPEIEYERFADDAIIHCRTEEQAKEIKMKLEERFAECKLELHPDKTMIAYCKDSNRKKEYPSSSICIFRVYIQSKESKE